MGLPGLMEVVEPGLFTTVQDLGRWEYVHLGITTGGSMDALALMAANLLVGNNPGVIGKDPGAAGLEITIVGPTLRFQEPCLIAVTGADLGPSINGNEVEGWKAHLVMPDATLGFSGRRSGARAYLAVSGGIAVEPWLGSRSTHLAASAGGLEGRALRAGDRLPLGSSSISLPALAGGTVPPECRPACGSEATVRVILGPHLDWFTEEGVSTFLSGRYQVTDAADRMGYRLQGPRIAHARGADVSSCGIPLGAIQVPGIGQPMVLLADRGLAGGYPQIGAVIQADLPVVAQRLPGDWLRFRAVSLEEARDSLRRLMEGLRRPMLEREMSLWAV